MIIPIIGSSIHVICQIEVLVDDIFLVRDQAEGIVLKEGTTKYLVDFSNYYSSNKHVKGIRYSKVLIEKDNCLILDESTVIPIQLKENK